MLSRLQGDDLVGSDALHRAMLEDIDIPPRLQRTVASRAWKALARAAHHEPAHAAAHPLVLAEQPEAEGLAIHLKEAKLLAEAEQLRVGHEAAGPAKHRHKVNNVFGLRLRASEPRQ